jgi:hypothetical protein
MDRKGRADSPSLAGPGRAVPALIQSTPLHVKDDAPDWTRLVPAWIISGAVHVVLLSLFLLVTLTSPAAVPARETIIDSVVTDESAARDAKNLVDDTPGNNPDLPPGFDVPANPDGPIVPGEFVADATPGFKDAPPMPLDVVPPPPGIGETGQGTGIDDPNEKGAGNMWGKEKGYINGIKLRPGDFGAGLSGATKQRLIEVGGGNTESELAVARALAWIARHQRNDGSWGMHDFHLARKCTCKGPGLRNDMAATALALLPFLAAGETHRAASKHSKYSKVVERGLEWIMKHQGEDGQLGDGYAHAIATIVLCEAYGLTSEKWLKQRAQRAIRCTVAWQAANGGFRYRPREAGDLSVSGWHIQALTSGQLAGLSVPTATFRSVNQFLDAVATADGSQYGYTDGRDINYRRTSIGLLCRQYMVDWGPRHPGLARGVEVLRKVPPTQARKDIYYYYYATQVMHHFGGDAWDQWNPAMRDLLIKTQDMGGDVEHRDQKGSWSPEGDPFGTHMGRLGTTALAVLTLEVYYRRLPLYWRQMGSRKDEPVKNAVNQ